MNFIGGSESFRYFKIISVNNKKIKDEGRYKTKASPGDAAKKAFTKLSKKYKTNKLTFSIKETTQGSSKREHGPYLGEKKKLKKPLEIKYEGKNKPVIIKYETKIHLDKNYKQKGGGQSQSSSGTNPNRRVNTNSSQTVTNIRNIPNVNGNFRADGEYVLSNFHYHERYLLFRDAQFQIDKSISLILSAKDESKVKTLGKLQNYLALSSFNSIPFNIEQTKVLITTIKERYYVEVESTEDETQFYRGQKNFIKIYNKLKDSLEQLRYLQKVIIDKMKSIKNINRPATATRPGPVPDPVDAAAGLFGQVGPTPDPPAAAAPQLPQVFNARELIPNLTQFPIEDNYG